MHRFLSGRFRILHLLALVQLLGGPLVLFQISLLCKLTIRETPNVGVTKAAVLAWHSDDFQSALALADPGITDGLKTSGPERAPKQKADPSKDPGIPWKAAALRDPTPSGYGTILDHGRIWTPVQAQPPPGPPPRRA